MRPILIRVAQSGDVRCTVLQAEGVTTWRHEFQSPLSASPELTCLLGEARSREVSEDELREQRVSFAFGNAPDGEVSVRSTTADGTAKAGTHHLARALASRPCGTMSDRMYMRPSHAPRSVADVVDVIRDNMFGTLVTASDAGITATHLPFVIDPERGEHGTLYAHMARANAQGVVAGTRAEALAIFAGPHAYISPSWYADRATAPTWDYIAVHCYGPVLRHSGADVLKNIERLLSVVEAPMPDRWELSELSDIDALLANVVSFEIPISRIEAKFKLNQGERPDRTRSAIAQLEERGATELAAYMRRYNDL